MSNAAAEIGSRSSLAGALCLVSGAAVFTLQDLIFKLLSDLYPVHELLSLRTIVAIAIICVFVWGNSVASRLDLTHKFILCLRGFIMFTAYTAYYVGLSKLSMVSCMALFFVAPIFAALLAHVFLREKVGVRRWLAILLGFGGIAVLLRPGGEILSLSAVFPLYGGFAYATTVIIVRKLHMRAGAAVMALYSNGVYLVAALSLAGIFAISEIPVGAQASIDFLVRPWQVPDAVDLGLVAVCGMIAAVGALLITQAYRLAPASTIAPFEYSALIWSVLLGWAAWGDWPDAMDWIGIAVIAACGTYVVTGRAEDEPG